MALAFVGGFWLTQYVMQELSGDDPTESTEIGKGNQLLMGDIIFHTSTSAQSFAIQEATFSVYSHVGLIEKIDNEYFVLEATQPVKRTALQDWINRGKDGKFAVKRLVKFDYLSTEKGKEHWKEITKSYLGKDYDSKFEWSDDNMYCSELVWKVYNQLSGLEIGTLQTLREFDVNSKPVGKKLVERFGDNIPWDQKIISPKAIFESPLLKEVISTY